MAKKLQFGEEARNSLRHGIEAVAEAVSITLGPKGKNVVLDRKYSTPLITNDGVTIAKEIELEDPFYNIGAKLIKEVSIKTNDTAGDGTTTACVLANAITKEGLKNIASGANPIILRKGIELATKAIIKKLKEISKPVSSDLEIAQVASISAGSDEIGNLIADAFKKVGKDGVVTIEESKTSQTILKITQGLEFDRGYISPYMISPESNFVNLEKPYIFVTDRKLSNLTDILGLLEQVMQTSRPLLIIADDVEGEVLSTLAINNIRGSFISVAVKTPSYGEKQKEFLEDICLITGATFISKELRQDLKTLSINDLGEVSQAKVYKDRTIIVGGNLNSEKIEQIKDNLRNNLTDELDNYDRIKLEDRLARLSGGVAVIEVGAASELELKEKKLRIEDALSATKSAMKEGIVAGGGCALISCIPAVEELIKTLFGDEQTGAKIVKDALEYPLRQIAINSGEDAGVVLEKVKLSQNNIGYNALEGTFVNMFDAGIIDPTKVTRCAIENAGSVAASILTTDVIVADTTEDTKK